MDGWLKVPVMEIGLSEMSDAENDKNSATSTEPVYGLPKLKVAVNGVMSDFSFKPQVTDWHSLALTDAKMAAAKVRLKKGINYISVIWEGPFISCMDFIKLSSDLSRTGISDSAYREFEEKVKNHSLYYPDNDAGGNRGNRGEIYVYELNKPVYYTAHQTVLLTAGDNFNVFSKPYPSSNGSEVIFNHGIYFHSTTNPASYSWFDLGSSYSTNPPGGIVNLTIPVSGEYCILILPMDSNTSEKVYCDYLINGKKYEFHNEDVTWGCMSLPDTYYSDSVNFFTCKTTGGNPKMWLEGYTSGSPGKIVGWNDNAGLISDYYWTANARIISTLPNGGAVWVGASSTNQSYFTTDVYAGLSKVPSPLLCKFLCLDEDNSFTSGTETGDPPNGYNCIDWSVGLTSGWNYYFNSYGYVNFYKSHGYELTTDSTNAAIALWLHVFSNGDSTYHASVRKNYLITIPHGFEWESKIGRYERIMHTKDALITIFPPTDTSYGNIFRYFKPVSNRNSNTVFQCSELTFSSSELNLISNLIDLIPDFVKAGFNAYFLTWKETWRRPEMAYYSNPRKYAESEDYKTLLGYCEKYGKAILPLIFEKLSKKESFIINLLIDLTFTENRYLYDESVSVVTDNPEVGKPFSSHSIWVDYSKKILEKEKTNILKSIQDIQIKEKQSFEINISFNNKEILLNLYSIKNEKANVMIYNVFGGLEYEEEYNISKGNQTIVINASNFKKGIYIVHVAVGNKIISQTINI